MLIRTFCILTKALYIRTPMYVLGLFQHRICLDYQTYVIRVSSKYLPSPWPCPLLGWASSTVGVWENAESSQGCAALYRVEAKFHYSTAEHGQKRIGWTRGRSSNSCSSPAQHRQCFVFFLSINEVRRSALKHHQIMQQCRARNLCPRPSFRRVSSVT